MERHTHDSSHPAKAKLSLSYCILSFVPLLRITHCENNKNENFFFFHKHYKFSIIIPIAHTEYTGAHSYVFRLWQAKKFFKHSPYKNPKETRKTATTRLLFPIFAIVIIIIFHQI